MSVGRIYQGGAGEQFPVGMRVLAVDDNPICLKLLQTLLHKCRYHVTTTTQATEALKLLQENKDMFDLVISDVHMPDMDGFKLLELVGLEMDLPVIMLSANDDTNLVMKGIIHGACDYLLKPVRMEELKNIWQHVVRKKKKVQPMGMNNFDKHEIESGQPLVTQDSDQNCKLNKKRKDQKEDDVEIRENGLRNEDSSNQKKARLLWTGELHRKFVAAVRTLGVDNAVPKKILNLMNVEKLTRENVASHLQKYRKYLDMINKQPNMVAALGGSEAGYLRMTSLDGYKNLQNSAMRPFSSNGLLGSRLHPSSGTFPLGHAQNLNKPNYIQPTFQSVINLGNQNENIFQGMTTSYKYEQLQLGNCGGNHSERPPNCTAKSSVFPISSNENQFCGTVPLPNMEFPSELPGFGRCTTSGSSSQPNPISRDSGNIMFPGHLNSCIPSLNGISDLRADFIQKLRSEENNFSVYQNPTLVCNSMNSMISSCGVLDSLIGYNDNFDNMNLEFGRNNDPDVVEMRSLADPQILQQTMVDQSALQTAYNMDQINQLGGYSYNDGSLEDLVSAVVKLDQNMFL